MIWQVISYIEAFVFSNLATFLLARHLYRNGVPTRSSGHTMGPGNARG